MLCPHEATGPIRTNMASNRNLQQDKLHTNTGSAASVSSYSMQETNPSKDEMMNYPPITVKELLHLLKEPDRLPAEMRWRKIPLRNLLDKNFSQDVFLCLLEVLKVICTLDTDDTRNIIMFLAKTTFLQVHTHCYITRLRDNVSSSMINRFNIIFRTFRRYAPDTGDIVNQLVVLLDISRRCNSLSPVIPKEDLTVDADGPTTYSMDLTPFPTAGEVGDSQVPSFSTISAGDVSMGTNYVTTQFQLLRQEIVEPLRKRISLYHQLKRNENENVLKECRMYSNVKVVLIITTHTSKGVTFRVEFQSNFPHDQAGMAQRPFAFGSLVCLTADNFHNMIFASVAKSEPKWVQKGFVELRLFRTEDVQKIASATNLIMFDSETYTEEHISVLESLRLMAGDGCDVPLSEYIVSLSPSLKHSHFLSKNPNIKYDVSPLIAVESFTQPRSLQRRSWKVPLSTRNEWPQDRACNVDEQQLNAIQSALTMEITVITGSYGTGKTYVCLKILHLILSNMKLHDSCENKSSPILFISSSRVTLDEFLLGVIDFQKTGIVRSGGKTQSDQLAEYDLEKQREKHKKLLSDCDKLHHAELDEHRHRLENICRNLSFLDSAILSVNELRTTMRPRQFKCFKNTERGEMLEWLLMNVVTSEDLYWLRNQIPKTKRPGVNHVADHDDHLFERRLSLDFLPGLRGVPPKVAALIQQINLTKQMSISEEGKEGDIWKKTQVERWQLYRLWVDKLRLRGQEKITRIYEHMESIAQKSQSIHDEVDALIFKNSSVIAMTIGAAVRSRRVLHRVRPNIVIVEEASDILPSTMMAVLPPTCQQLILIGNTVPRFNQNIITRKLTEEQGFESSLMQRFIRNDFPIHTLKTQHRMNPSVSKISQNLLAPERHIEHTLPDNDIPGMIHNVFFIQQYDAASPANHEASFLLGLFSYLLHLGLHKDQITVLTTFPAQSQLFKGKILDRLQTVDNFRGENDVVLFLSNGCERKSKIGCLQIEQRLMCVLTAARKALYIIGNFQYLVGESDLWARVIKEASHLGLVGTGLKISCPRHKHVPYTAYSLMDFMKKQNSECTLPCVSKLRCRKHSCKRSCHDHSDDDESACVQPCTKIICENGHKCKERCSDPCTTTCTENVLKELPCGHLQSIPCHLSRQSAACRAKCEKKLDCGHHCSNECGEPCNTRCVEKTKKSSWSCGHTVEVQCCDGPESCPEPCNIGLMCGHQCLGTCGKCRSGRLHLVCDRLCGRILICGHRCEASCSASCPPCRQQCENSCPHSACKNLCGEACVQCNEACAWRCPHIACQNLCGEPCEREPCNNPCRETLPCGHPCIGICGEKCPDKCRICDHEGVTEIFFGNEDEEDAWFVQLQDCGHVIEVEGLDKWMNQTMEPEVIQLKMCPKCKTLIRKNMRYGDQIKKTLVDVEVVKKKMRERRTEIESMASRFNDTIHHLKKQAHSNESLIGVEDLEKLSAGQLVTSHFDMIQARSNRCKFINVLNQIYLQARQIKCNHYILKERQSRLHQTMLILKSFLCDGNIDRFTEQQVIDVEGELSRAKFQLQACAAVNTNIPWLERNSTPGRQSYLTEFDNIVNKHKPFTEEDAERAGGLLEIMKKDIGHAVLGVTNLERVQIIQAIGLGKGHWYKCP